MHLRHDIEVYLGGQIVERVLPCLLDWLCNNDLLALPKWRKLVSVFDRTVQRRKSKIKQMANGEKKLWVTHEVLPRLSSQCPTMSRSAKLGSAISDILNRWCSATNNCSL